METIDGEWIKARLRGYRGEKAELAEAAHLKPKQVSEILAGQRGVRQDEAARIMRFFGIRPEEPSAQVATAQAFKEAPATPFDPKPNSPAERLMATLRRDGRHPVLHKVTRDMTEHALLRGDILIIDMKNNTPAQGDLVICGIRNEVLDEFTTDVRRWFPPWLISGERGTTRNGDGATIYGTVIGSLRGSAF